MAQKVKVRVSKAKSLEQNNKFHTNEAQLAHRIIEHVRACLPKQFDYILKYNPEVSFVFASDRCILDSIRFESEDEDSICIDEEGVGLYLAVVDKYDTLFENEGFFDIFRMRTNNICKLKPDVKEALIQRRAYHMEMF